MLPAFGSNNSLSGVANGRYSGKKWTLFRWVAAVGFLPWSALMRYRP
ncbi:hypothetical protein FHU41_002556 [Psychromicrobium silvestre]|uniref:Uncharacterized protein n=1 Tax=Psychromicrobium silvestre TaxID=1645614 RepID=A0A7Y9S8T3_9MICC|nr:hypothetical protein [Psychromicrobium silvestre]